MRFSTVFLIAWKNLWAHRMRAILTIGGVAIGVAAILFLVSLGYGLERLVTSQVANFEAFKIIDIPSANLKTGHIDQEAISRIQNVPHVAAITQIVDLAGRVKLSSQNATTETVVMGVEPDYFKQSGVILASGSIFTADDANSIILNKTLAGLLGYASNSSDAIGQTIQLDLIISPDLRLADQIDGSIVKSGLTLKVIGITDDSSNPVVYVALPLVRQNGVVYSTSLKASVDDEKNVTSIRQAIENIGFSTEYVGDTVAEIDQFFSLFRIILAGFGMIAVIVASLATFNMLTVSLMERIREIALMRTLGMQEKAIFRLFLVESLIISLIGGVLGIILGSIIGLCLNATLSFLAHRAGADPISIYYSPALFIAYVAIGTTVIGFLTGYYPARKAIKTKSIDALRYE